MLVILGYLVVLGTVFGGYMMTGGHLGALYQPAELIIIGGAGVGAFIVGNNGKAIKATMKALPLLFRGSKYNKSAYMDLMALLYRLMAKSRQQGMFSLERDIENPKESEIFASYPRILADKVMLEFITDYLRLIIGNGRGACAGLGGSPGGRTGRVDCPCHGGDFPRHFAGLWLCLAAGDGTAPEERRNHQNDAVRQSHAAVQPERLRAADRRRIWS